MSYVRMMVAKVTKLHPGQNGQAGTVDVQLLNRTPHETLYGIPYILRREAGWSSGREPAVGDIGPISIVDRRPPARRFDMFLRIKQALSRIRAVMLRKVTPDRRFSSSDTVFLGNILNEKATKRGEMAGDSMTHTPTPGG